MPTRTATPVTAALSPSRRIATPVTVALRRTVTRVATPVTIAVMAGLTAQIGLVHLVVPAVELERVATPVTVSIAAPFTRPATPVTVAVSGPYVHVGSPVTVALQVQPNRLATPVTVSLMNARIARFSLVQFVIPAVELERVATPVTISLRGGISRTASPVTISLSGPNIRPGSPATVALQTTATRTGTPVTAAIGASFSISPSPIFAYPTPITLTLVGVSTTWTADSVFDVSVSSGVNLIAFSLVSVTDGQHAQVLVELSILSSGTLTITVDGLASSTVSVVPSPGRIATPVTISITRIALIRTATPVTVSLAKQHVASPVTIALSGRVRAARPVTVALQSEIIATPSTITESGSWTIGLAGSGTLWDGATSFSLTPTGGATVSSRGFVVNSSTSATLTLTTGPGAGTLTVSDGQASVDLTVQLLSVVIVTPPAPPTGSAIFSWIEPDGTVHELSGQPDLDIVQGRQNLHMPTVRLTEDRVPGMGWAGGGAHLRDHTYESREVDLPLFLHCADYATLWRRHAEITSWFRIHRNAAGVPIPGLLRCTAPDGTVRQLTCVYSGGLHGVEGSGVSGPNYRRMILQLKASDPLWYSTDLSTSSFQIATSTAFFTNPFLPLHLALSNVTVVGELDNVGDEVAWPVWQIVGPGTNPTLTNLTTGQVLALTLVLSGGQSVTIDTRPSRKSIVNDQSQVNLYSALSPGNAAMWPLQPGSNALQLVMSGATTASRLVLSYRPAFLGP